MGADGREGVTATPHQVRRGKVVQNRRASPALAPLSFELGHKLPETRWHSALQNIAVDTGATLAKHQERSLAQGATSDELWGGNDRSNESC
jgi:hypothetical protein